MSQWNFDNDRRSHFRIEEQAEVHFRLLKDGTKQSLHALFPDSADIGLLTDLRLLNDEAELLLRKIAEQDKASASYLRLLNRKIERIAQFLIQPQGARQLTGITLSEGGVSMLSKDPLATNTLLALQIRLGSEGLGLLARARVVYSLESAPERFRSGCQFLDLDEQQLHLLARHSLEAQARQRRMQRDRQPQEPSTDAND